MNDVVDLGKFRRDRQEATSENSTGDAHCLECGYEWVQVSPVGAYRLQCPHCGSMKGVFDLEVHRNIEHWECTCKNDLMKVTKSGIYCPRCGEWQTGF